MAGREPTIIALDAAHQALSAFGVGPENKAYQRRRRDTGFRLADLEEVLAEGESVLIVDWRDWLHDVLETIQEQLRAIDIAADSDLGEDGEEGTVEIGGRREPVKFIPNDDDDFDQVIRSINSLIQGLARYRKFRFCEGSDGWSYGLLSDSGWMSLESSISELLDLLFGDDGA